jgi:hypothetical protein
MAKKMPGLRVTPWGMLRAFARINLHCPYCSARPNQQCRRVKSGKPYSDYVHDDRVKPVLNIFYIGRGVGKRQAWDEVAALVAKNV